MYGYLSADIICFEKRTVSRELSLRKTASFEEQIMSKEKYRYNFPPNGGYYVSYPLNISWNLHIFKNWVIFSHLTSLDQLRMSENTWRFIVFNRIRWGLPYSERAAMTRVYNTKYVKPTLAGQYKWLTWAGWEKRPLSSLHASKRVIQNIKFKFMQISTKSGK